MWEHAKNLYYLMAPGSHNTEKIAEAIEGRRKKRRVIGNNAKKRIRRR